MRMKWAAEDRDLWRAVGQFIDCTEKQQLLEFLAHHDPALHTLRELLPVAHGDQFLLRELLAELERAGLVQRLRLREGAVYSLMQTPGLRENVLRLSDYYAGRNH